MIHDAGHNAITPEWVPNDKMTATAAGRTVTLKYGVLNLLSARVTICTMHNLLARRPFRRALLILITLMCGTLSACSPQKTSTVDAPPRVPPSSSTSEELELESPAESTTYKDGVTGLEIQIPKGWNPHQIMGSTIIFCPVSRNGYKPRIFLQRQQNPVGRDINEHLQEAEKMILSKKYKDFEIKSKQVKKERGPAYAELVYYHRNTTIERNMIDSVCIIQLSGNRWILLQCSAVDTAFAEYQPEFDVVKNSLLQASADQIKPTSSGAN